MATLAEVDATPVVVPQSYLDVARATNIILLNRLGGEQVFEEDEIDAVISQLRAGTIRMGADLDELAESDQPGGTVTLRVVLSTDDTVTA